jgi:hypothetical protein
MQFPIPSPFDASQATAKGKWTLEEDTKVVELRKAGMKWEDISKSVPGRSATSCRLRSQNYLEKPDRRNKDARNLAIFIQKYVERQNLLY